MLDLIVLELPQKFFGCSRPRAFPSPGRWATSTLHLPRIYITYGSGSSPRYHGSLPITFGTRLAVPPST